MSSADVAIDYARKLVNAEARGHGDVEAALDRIEAKTGIGRWTLWALWHKRRKVADGDLIGRLRGAYLAYCEHKIAHWQHEHETEAARCGNDDLDADLAAEAEAILAKIRSRKEKR